LKVLLVQPLLNPGYDLPPLGIASVASALKESGHEVRILDFNLQPKLGASVKASVSKCLKYDVDLIGLTCWGNMAPFVIEFSKRYKSVNPEAKIVIGGEYASLRPEDILRESRADFIVRGEGEQTLPQLIREIEEGGNPYKVEGISYRRSNRIISTPDRRLMDMDDIPFTDWGLFDDLNEYKGYAERSHSSKPRMPL